MTVCTCLRCLPHFKTSRWFLPPNNDSSTKLKTAWDALQGRGIKLVQCASGLQQALKDLAGIEIIASKYLHKPLLVNGFKFDLRVYVLVLACDPLRVFVYKEGLVRFCTEKYKAPQVSHIMGPSFIKDLLALLDDTIDMNGNVQC